MIPLAEPDLAGNEARYLQECIATRFVSSVGPFVDRFESMVAAAVGAPAAVATSSGTTALHVALTSLGVGRDDLVILPSYTFIASANAISHCGATPWLIDIDAETWALDPTLLKAALADETERAGGAVVHKVTGRRVAAVLPVYAFGTPADMDAIATVAESYGLPVVADAAAAIGATYRGRPLGKLGATLSVLSFNGNKTVTAGGGGAVFGTDESLLGLVRHLTATARPGSDYSHDRIGFNYRMINLAAAVGCAQMERLGALIAGKRRIAAIYRDAFAEKADLAPFPSPDWAASACWLSGVVAADADRADKIRASLKTAGIAARTFWMPVHRQAPYTAAPAGPQPISDGLWRRVVPLPCSAGLVADQQEQVIGAVMRGLAA